MDITTRQYESTRTPPPRGASAERGMVMIWAMTTMLMIAGIVATATEDIRATNRGMDGEFALQGQAREIARAGLIDAYSWMRRQPTQPVMSFTPQRDLSADPVIDETDDPDIGLVRSFEIVSGLWARYEVRRGAAAEGFTDFNGNGLFDLGEPYDDENGDGRWTPGRGTRDISVERGQPAGADWLLVCEAQVFRRPRSDLPLGEGPNRSIARATLATEVRRLAVQPPADASICAGRGDGISLSLRARIGSESTAIAYPVGTGTPDTASGDVDGSITPILGLDVSVDTVFGMDWSGLRAIADHLADATAPTLPELEQHIHVIDGDMVFDQDRPLRGNGIVAVRGDARIAAASNAWFQGLLYVEGDLEVDAPTFLRGSVVVTGDITVRGSGADFAEIEHDLASLSDLLQGMGHYRHIKAPFEPAPTLLDGRPAEQFIRGRGGVAPSGDLPELPLDPVVADADRGRGRPAAPGGPGRRPAWAGPPPSPGGPKD